MPVEALAGQRTSKPSSHVGTGPSTHGGIGNLSAGCHLATLLAWKRCGEAKLCMDYGQSIYGKFLSIALLQKNDTGVSPRYSYKLFLYLLFYIPEMTNLTMLFNF